jgi:hypothetical protein
MVAAKLRSAGKNPRQNVSYQQNSCVFSDIDNGTADAL